MKSTRFTVEKDGFCGVLYPPAEDAFPGKVLIVLGGGDGSFAATKRIARKLARGGIAAAALAYWKRPGLPTVLEHIPIECLGAAPERLSALGYDKIGLWGVSMGAELVLLAASLMPEKFSCVAAASPIFFVTQGVRSFLSVANGAAFSFGGKALPHAPFREQPGKAAILRESVKRREFSVRFLYDDIWESPPEDAVIPVENMRASLLLFSGQKDSMWPAFESAERIMARLDGHGYPYPHAHISYEHGSHFMLPLSLITDAVYRAERQYRTESREIKEDIFQRTMRFFRESW